jgi:hypothetical protein
MRYGEMGSFPHIFTFRCVGVVVFLLCMALALMLFFIIHMSFHKTPLFLYEFWVSVGDTVTPGDDISIVREELSSRFV